MTMPHSAPWVPMISMALLSPILAKRMSPVNMGLDSSLDVDHRHSSPVSDFVSTKSVMLAIDNSVSMNEILDGTFAVSHFQEEVDRLRKAIKNLRSDQQFTTLAFSSKIKESWKGMRPGTEENKEEALAWLSNLKADGHGANIEAVLKRAQNEDKLEALHLLSDGEATVGCDHLECMQPLLNDRVKVHTTYIWHYIVCVFRFVLYRLQGKSKEPKQNEREQN